jgi:membrane protease YdiL (CAAX protease family)
MSERKAAAVRGLQIAFLIFAVVFLNAPLDKYVYAQWQWARDLDLSLGRALMIVSGAVVLAAIAPVRRECSRLLEPRIPRRRRGEVALAVSIGLLAGFATFGAIALWHYLRGGEPALARAMGEYPSHAEQLQRALSTGHLVMFIFVAGLIGPIAEELAFRGLLYNAWRRAFGWLGAAVASSLAFGLFHGLVWPQFIAGLIYVAAYRRSGSLRTSIYSHSLHNLLLWYPLVGQFLLPAGRSTGELHLWTFHLACLAGAVIAIPWYLWSARESRIARPSEFAEPGIA